MIKTDEDALMCDLAETYNIYDYKKLPALRVASFSVGLREDSRIKMKISNVKLPVETMLLASIFDHLSLLVWSKTENGRNGINKPQSVLNVIFNKEQNDEVLFETSEDFMKARKNLLRKDC